MAADQSNNQVKTAPDRPNQRPLPNLIVNIVIPSVILWKFSKDEYLGAEWGIVIALAFPVAWFFFDLAKDRKVNFISILGVVSVLLTGGIGLLRLDPMVLAIKEASVPAIIGALVLVSMKTPWPLVHKLIYSDHIFDTARVQHALKEHGNEPRFNRLLVLCTWILAGSFFLSAVLNYVLARVVVKSMPGSPAFNEELGKMTALSWPVISVPSLIVLLAALFILIRGIRNLTGLTLEDIMHNTHNQKSGNDE